MNLPKHPGARMRALLIAGAIVAALVYGIAETVALQSGESILWTISKVSWQATNENPVFAVLPFGLLMFVCGHLFFPKGKCAHCGSRPWASDQDSREAFVGKLLRFANLRVAEWKPGNTPDTKDLMRRAGFPAEE